MSINLKKIIFLHNINTFYLQKKYFLHSKKVPQDFKKFF